MVAKAGLRSQVEFLLGDAREVIPSLSGPFDFVLLDLWKELYIRCFDLVYPKLGRGAYVAADNMIHPRRRAPMAKLTANMCASRRTSIRFF